MGKMTITPLDTLSPDLTEEQKEAADQIRNPGKRFLAKGFPGGTPDLARLREYCDRFVNQARHQTVTLDRGPVGFEISLGGRHA